MFLLLYVILIFWSIICVFPFYWLFISTFKNFFLTSQGPFYLPFVDFNPNLNLWINVLSDKRIIISIINSLKITLSSSIITIIIGSLCGYALARFRYKIRLEFVAFMFLFIILTSYALYIKIDWLIICVSVLSVYILIIYSKKKIIFSMTKLYFLYYQVRLFHQLQ